MRCWAEIDLAALERNLALIRKSLPAGVRLISVVKADAYGHGIHHTATRLMQAGADTFAVANTKEAADIREMGSGWPILVLGPLLPEEDQALLDYDLIAALSSPEELARFQALAQKNKRQISVHLKIDTGMGRLGVWWGERAVLDQGDQTGRPKSSFAECSRILRSLRTPGSPRNKEKGFSE